MRSLNKKAGIEFGINIEIIGYRTEFVSHSIPGLPPWVNNKTDWVHAVHAQCIQLALSEFNYAVVLLGRVDSVKVRFERFNSPGFFFRDTALDKSSVSYGSFSVAELQSLPTQYAPQLSVFMSSDQKCLAPSAEKTASRMELGLARSQIRKGSRNN
jgi:hypothetical protein